MDAPDPRASQDGEEVEVVVDLDAVRVGAVVRARLEAGERVAGFVGDSEDPAVAEFVADVIRPGSTG